MPAVLTRAGRIIEPVKAPPKRKSNDESKSTQPKKRKIK